MKVKATEKGFYNKLMVEGECFTIKPRSDEFIISQREEKSDKKVTAAEQSADIDLQFSSVWMEKVLVAKSIKG